MRSSKGRDYWLRGLYREVTAGERLVITLTVNDSSGIARFDEVITVAFAEDRGKTRLTVQATASGSGDKAAAMIDAMQGGWHGSLDRLDSNLRMKGDAMQVQPYLFFDGRCDEALDYYRKTLGAEVGMLMRFKESPDPHAVPPNGGDKVMHAALRIGDTVLFASDGHCTGRANFEGFALSLAVKDEAEAERRFNALADGGQVQMPLQKTFYSPRFGMVTDRFGVGWMVIVPQS
jgi:PhnB protein